MKPENLETVQRLSPDEESLLFEAVTGTGQGHVRSMTLSLRGPLDVPAWRRAWESAVARHRALRTTFHWKDLERPFRVVHRQTALPWQELEGEDPEEAAFDLAEAPPLRLALVHQSEEVHRFVWSWHRLILDDASALGILREVRDVYDRPLTVLQDEVKELEVGEAPAQVLRSSQDDTRTPVEVLVERAWRGFPGVKTVGGDLLAQAAHPFQTLRLLAKLREVFGVELAPRDLAEEPTVAGLARRIERKLRAGEGSGAPPVVPIPRIDDAGLPASFSQERLWFIDQLEPGSAVYNMPTALRVTGPLDVEALARALAGIERRHEVLRTVFPAAEGSPRQVVLPPGSFRLREVDLAGLGPVAREARLTALAAEEAMRPFDLARGPLWRATLLRLGPEEHAVLITLHHVVSDGWSTGVLIGELTALYGSRLLPELPIQYADYAVWQRWWLQGETLQRELDWWRRELAGAPVSLDLPADRPRPAVQSHRGALRHFALPRPLSERLLALSRAEGATLFMTVLAAFQALLARWSGQLDVSVGTPVAGRNRVELEPLIGFFVNTLVLRTDLGGDPSFRELLARVRQRALGAQAHQELPFDKLVSELEPERSLSRAPLFQVMLVLQNAPVGELEVRGLRMAPVEAPRETAQFDLTLTLEEGAGGIAGDWVYSTDLFDAATIARLGGHFERLLEAAADSPAGRLSELPLLTGAETRQILVEWNDTRAPQPGYASVHALFEAQARRTPEAPAVLWGGGSLTFGDLDRRANRLARELVSRGVGPESRVALYLGRGSDAIVALLAVWKAGGAWLAVDPEQPARRTAEILRDAAPAVVLTHGTLTPPPVDASVVHLDTADTSGSTEPLDLPGSRDRLAYVVYTSGSTGTPKGTLIPHGAVLNFLAAMERAVFSGPASPRRVSVNAPLFFDASVQQLVQGLRGHTLVPVPEEVRRDGEALREFLERQEVDVLDCTPSQLRVLLDAGFGEAGRRAPGHVLVGGEAIDQGLWERLGRISGIRFFNVYGPTEATVNATVRPVEGRSPQPAIGRPISNVRLYVLAPDLALLPAGVTGELLIGGEGLARGYLNRPGLTAERFIPDPFAVRPGSRLYRTGDLARWTADGELELIGRIDHQVKIRGFRVELGEVESVLATHPGVRAAAVLVRESTGGDRRLAACVVPEAEVSAAELRDFLRERLPAPMVPSSWSFLDALPLTANAKVDRRALASLVPDAPGLDTAGGAAPRTPAEELVAGVWADVLGLERVGAGDDFFALGGHSLLGARVMARLRGIFGVDLPLRDLFEAPTVAGLAARVETALRAGAGQTARPPLAPMPREGDLPLSFAQQRLWFIDQLEPGSPLYNIVVALRLEGGLEIVALAAALTEIERRHESLRTVFVSAAGEPRQVVRPSAPFPLGLIDLSGLGERRETESYRLAVAAARRPFDLERGPLWRGALVRLREDEHVALLTLHHVIGDGWSTGLLVDEVAALYPAFTAGQPSPLPELPVQYGDFAVWQRGWLQGEVLEREIAWWRERLAGAPALLELPADRPRPEVQAGRGNIHLVELPGALTAALHGFSLRLGATPFMTLLAAFQAVLSRWSHQRDISVGTPVAGRDRVELEGLIGFFANTLVLRADLESGDPGFRGLVAQARQVSLDAHLHQDLPFEKLVEELAPERSLTHSPLFQAMLVLQNTGREDLVLPGLTIRGYDLESGTAKFDLLLALGEGGGRFTGAFEYDAALFDAPTIARLRGHFETLLAAGLAAPDVPVAELPLLTPAERAHLLAGWNDAGRPPERPVHELIAARPDAPALLWPEGEWTYAELTARARRLSRRLRALGAGPEVPVAVCAERGPELVLALLAILESGGAYLPLDPSYPRERLAFMLEDAGAALLLAQPRFLAQFSGIGPDTAARVLDLNALVDLAQEDSDTGGEELPGVLHPDQAAYLVYTSGSTGIPKGMCQTHRTLSYLVAWQIASSPETAAARTLQFASPGFDVSVQEVLATWCAGGTLVIGPEEVRRDPERLAAVLAERRIERLFLPFVALQQLAEQVAGGEPPAGLREVVTAGERLQVTPEVAALFERLGSVPRTLRNQYGPSETHVATEYALAGEPASWEALPPIGRPLPGARVYLVDPRLELVPAGVPGEMLVGGSGLARGYLRRPDLTAERFLPDPFGGETGARVYRTGDLARLRTDGELEFLGRADRQVKIRGFRVEPEEIEAVLARHPAVRESAVVVREERPGDRRLIAYVTGSTGPIAPAELRRFAREALPEHMVPAFFVPIDALPLTPSGKVDRRALSSLEVAGPLEPGEAFAAPRDLVEEGLASVWEEVLRIERAGAHDNFFDLGGHSLSATRVMARVRDAFGIDLPLRALFEAPTIARLAGRVRQALRREARPAAPPLVAIPPELRPRPPLSFAQQRLWFLDQLEPGSPLYNLPAALRLDGDLDVEALSRAVGEIVRRHESLRTTFPAVDGEPVQRVHPWGEPFVLPRVDLTGVWERAEPEARRLAMADADRPFDLERGPLFRPLLIRLTRRSHGLLATMHHVVGDGWSMGVLVRELAALYAAFRSGLPSPLPELPLQYPDFALWQRSWLAGEVLEAELAWWRGRLAGLPALLELPADRPRPAVRTTRGAWRPAALPEELAARLRGLARAHGTTLFMALLAGFQTLLSRYSGQRDLAVGMPIAGRNRVELEGLIGFLVNTLVLRADLSDGPSFAGLLRRTRETALGAYAHQDLPFEKLVEELAPERSLGHTPLFQVLFALQNAPREALELPELRVGALPAEDPNDPEGATAKFDLLVTLEEGGDRIAGSISYATDLFDRATIDRLWGHFANLLAAASAGPEAPVAGLSLLDAAELQQLLVDWNATATPYPRQRTIPDLFAEQVALRPGAPALEWGERTLTYAALDRLSGDLAHRLRSLGVGPEVRVAVCLERSPEMIVAFLAALKAGGAYVPLDLSYPWERLAWMLEDSGSRVLVAEAGLFHSLPDGALAGGPLQVVLLEADRRDAPEEPLPPLPPLPGMAPESLAYVMYTSGSTGRPKGVAVPQRAIVRLVRDTDYAQLTPDDRVAQVSNPVFDAATFEIWGALLNGGCLVGIEREIVLSPLELADALRRRRISATFLTAALFHQIAHDVPGAFSTVRHLLAGGDAIEPRWARAVLKNGPPERLLNGYGPTETTTFAVWHRIQAVPPGAATVPIGRPLANTRLYVLDPELGPQPAGVPGELYIGGDGVARGYHGRPGLTAERFVPDPWGEPGDRLYRTGDLVRYRRSGELEFLGRIDRQVKIRGFRIEPGEIEAALLEYPGVKEVVVMVRQDPGAGAPQGDIEKRLAAYFVAGEPDLDGAALRRHLEGRLPAYMVPASFTRLEALPLNPNGKVDRAALPVPEGARSAVGFEEPATPTERELAAIWAEVLDAGRVGAGDDFFQLGGHSLLAVRATSRMRAAFHLDLSVRLLFDTPRLRDLAAAIEREQLAQAGEADLAELLAELEGLSDEEALELTEGDDV